MVSNNSNIYNKLWPVLLLPVLFFIRYHDAIINNKIFGHSKDHIYLLGPSFFKVNKVYQAGETPIFIPELLAGIPFFDSALFSITYPFYFLQIANYEVGISSLEMISFVVLFHLFILFAGTFVLLRAINIKNWIALFAACIPIIAMNTARNTAWVIAIAGYAWIPLFFAGIIMILDKKRNLLGVCLLALSSMGFLAKPAQTTILAIFFGMVIVLYGLWKKRNDIKTHLQYFSLAGVLILAINFVGIVIMFMNFGDKMRFTPSGPVYGHQKINQEAFDAFVEFHEVPSYLIFKGIEFGPGHPYVGPFALILGLLGLGYFFYRKRAQLHWSISVFSYFFIACFLLAFGKETPLFNIHYYTPLLDKIREPVRFLFIGNIALSVLCGVGLQFLYEKSESLPKWLAPSLFFIISSILTFQLHITNSFSIVYFIIPFAIIMIALFLVKRKSVIHSIAILALIIANFIIIPSGRYGKVENSGVNKIENVKSMDILDQLSHEPDAKTYRFVANDKVLADGKWAQNGLYFGMKSFYASITPLPGQQFKEIYNSDKFYFYRSLWGAKYHIFPNDAKPSSVLYKKTNIKNERYTAYENPRAKKDFYMVNKIKKFEGSINQFKEHLEEKKDFLPSQCYLNETHFKEYFPKFKNSKKLVYDIQNIVRKNNSSEFQISNEEAGILVINEYYNEDWKISIDGTMHIPIPVNMNQMGIYLEKGVHKVQMNFEPAYFQIAYYLQKFAFLVLIGLFGFYFFKKRNE